MAQKAFGSLFWIIRNSMAKVYLERAYIEPSESDSSHKILIHAVSESEGYILVGKVELDRDIPWIHLETDENGDLLINNSAGMENNKWNHITREIIGESNG